MRRDKLSGGRRRRRAQIGGKISDREISFVSHGRDYRNRRRPNRAGDSFFIESPKILNRSTAAPHYYYIYAALVIAIAQRAFVVLVEKSNCAHNLVSSAIALHAGRGEQNVDCPRASRDHVEDIANRGAACRRDHAHAFGKNRNRTL